MHQKCLSWGQCDWVDWQKNERNKSKWAKSTDIDRRMEQNQKLVIQSCSESSDSSDNDTMTLKTTLLRAEWDEPGKDFERQDWVLASFSFSQGSNKTLFDWIQACIRWTMLLIYAKQTLKWLVTKTVLWNIFHINHGINILRWWFIVWNGQNASIWIKQYNLAFFQMQYFWKDNTDSFSYLHFI
jgi:hypothetical protein